MLHRVDLTIVIHMMQKYQSFHIAFCLLMGCTAKAEAPLSRKSTTIKGSAKMAERKEVDMIQESWEGRIFVSSNWEEEAIEPQLQLIIRNEKQLTEFVDRLPKKTIQMRQPAPESTDPFVNGLKIDFTTSMLLVSIRNNSMYAKSPITRVMEQDGKIIAVINVQAAGDSMMMAAMSDVGTYCAVRIPVSSQDIVFLVK